MRKFTTGSTRDTDTTKLDYRGFFSPQVLRRRAEYMHEHRTQADGQVRDSDNWKKGIPRKVYLSSLIRHVHALHERLEWVQPSATNADPLAQRQGEPPTSKEIEGLLCAVMFNAEGLLHERLIGRDTPEQVVPTVVTPVERVETELGRFKKYMGNLHLACQVDKHYKNCTHYQTFLDSSGDPK